MAYMQRVNMTGDITSVNIKSDCKEIVFAINFPISDILMFKKRSIMSSSWYEIVNYIDKTKYEKLENDLKFNVAVQFNKQGVSFSFSAPDSEPVHLESFYVFLDNPIQESNILCAYNVNRILIPNEWYDAPVDVNVCSYLFTNTINSHNSYGMFCTTVRIKIKNKDLDLKKCIDSMPSLTEDIKNLLNDSTSSDVTVKSVEGAAWPAHKLILSARSAVFKAHFEHGTRESSTDIIETSLETEVLQELLYYIYTDTAPNCDTMVMKLLAAADYYQLNGLKLLCEEAMLKKVTVENAVETLVQADLYSANNLKKFILKFINKDVNKAAIFKTDGWKTLQSVELLRLLYEGSLE